MEKQQNLIKFNTDTLHYISVFETITNTPPKDCVVAEDKLVFIVEEGSIGKAIGRNARNIASLKEIFKKSIQIIEHSNNPKKFIANIFKSYKVLDVVIEQRGNVKHATVTVSPAEKERAIGKEGKNLKLARNLLSRYHGITSINIA